MATSSDKWIRRVAIDYWPSGEVMIRRSSTAEGKELRELFWENGRPKSRCVINRRQMIDGECEMWDPQGKTTFKALFDNGRIVRDLTDSDDYGAMIKRVAQMR